MRELKFCEAICEALEQEMRRDPDVFLMGEDIAAWNGNFKATKGLLDKFGEKRVKDTPISELGPSGMAVGAAMAGLKPVMEISYMDWITLAMDPIVNQAAKARYMYGGRVHVPIVFRTAMGPGKQRAAQHSQSFEAWFCHVPGLKVAVPSNPYDAKGLLIQAIRDPDPVMFLEHKMIYEMKGQVPEEEYIIPFGKAAVRRTGKDLTIVAVAKMVGNAMEAADILAKEGIDAEVIDPRTLVPLDVETICQSVQKTGRLMIAHDSAKRGGIGGEIAASVLEEKATMNALKAPVFRVAALDLPLPFNKELEKQVIPGTENIVRAARQMLEK